MNCNCQWTEAIIAILIIVFSLWTGPFSKWIVILAGAVLLIHSLSCKNCKCSVPMESKKPMPKKATKARRRR